MTTQPASGPWTDERNRLALEAYADRLARHHDRLADDLEAAHLRIRWQAYERRACHQLDPQQVRALTDVGVIDSTPDELDDRRLIQRRREQLAALSDLQRLVEREIQALSCPPTNGAKDERDDEGTQTHQGARRCLSALR